MKIVADAHIPYIKNFFAGHGDLILKPGREITPADVRDADLLIVRSITQVNAKLLTGSKVKFVGSVTAGADHLDTEWLDEVGIEWSVATGFNAPPVADYVVAVVAALQKQGVLPKNHFTAAVVGVGNVGRRVVAYLHALNANVILCDPFRAEAESDFISATLQDLDGLDFISLHVPLTKAGKFPTYHLIDKHFLARQKQNCVLLNASRGAVVDSIDLLNTGAHLRHCLDVWEHEPDVAPELLKSATIATPHIAGYSIQSKIRGIAMIYQLACEKNLITAQAISPIEMPTHVVNAHAGLDWRDVILEIFNPLAMTEHMKNSMLGAWNANVIFDELRNQFNYRHEFAYTHCMAKNLSATDKSLLETLSLSVR